MTVTNVQPDPSPRWMAVYASAARAATPNAVAINTDSFDVDGMVLLFTVSAVSGTLPSVTFTVQGYDPVSAATYELGTGTAISTGAMTAAGTQTVRIQPQIPNGTTPPHQVAQDMVPPVLLVTATHLNTTGTLTYSVSALLDL